MDVDHARDREQRLTLSEAAEVLGTTKDAVRMRVRRETLRSEKGEDGRVYVFLYPTTNNVHPEPEVETGDAPRELVEVLRAQVEDLRVRLDREQEANRENRRIIAGLTQRIPELEAAASPAASQSPQDRPEESAEGSRTPGSAETVRTGPERVPWWRRIF